MIIKMIKVNDDDDDGDDEGYRLLMTQQQRLLPASISRPPRDFPLFMFCYFSITVIHFSVSSSPPPPPPLSPQTLIVSPCLIGAYP